MWRPSAPLRAVCVKAATFPDPPLFFVSEFARWRSVLLDLQTQEPPCTLSLSLSLHSHSPRRSREAFPRSLFPFFFNQEFQQLPLTVKRLQSCGKWGDFYNDIILRRLTFRHGLLNCVIDQKQQSLVL